MKLVTLALVLMPAAAMAASPQHFSLAASFVAPAKAGANGTIAVTFTPKDPDLHVNEQPAPRIKLDAAQTVLVDKQPAAPTRTAPYDSATAKSLDLKAPLTFPVAFAPNAPVGPQTVNATVTYFYCSKREGWCRKGSTDVTVPVSVP